MNRACRSSSNTLYTGREVVGAGNSGLQRKEITREEERRSGGYSSLLLIDLIEIKSNLQTTERMSGDYGEPKGRRPRLFEVSEGSTSLPR